jgi:hypothetical protein
MNLFSWTFIKNFIAFIFMGYIGCDIHGFEFSDLIFSIVIETVLQDDIPQEAGCVLRDGSSYKSVNVRIVGVVSPKDCILHGIASPERLLRLGIGKINAVLSWIFISIPGSVVPHRLHHESWSLACHDISGTSYHKVHSESIFSLNPYLFSLSQVASIHHNVLKTKRPLEAKLGFPLGIETGLMNSESCLRHAGECPDYAWEPNSSERDGVLDFPNKDNLILIESEIGQPVEIAHGI